MKKNRLAIFMLVVGVNLAFAAETDAEILKDLDFFSELDVFREGTVFEEGSLEEDDVPEAEAPKATPPASGGSK